MIQLTGLSSRFPALAAGTAVILAIAARAELIRSMDAPKRKGGEAGGPGESAAAPEDAAVIGLQTTLFRGQNFEREVGQRVDKQLVFLWVDEAPDPALPANGYSIRWRGWLKAPLPGDYTLIVASDDGVRVWLDDQLIIDDWRGHFLTRHEVPVKLTARPHKLQVDYFEANQGALLSLRWAMGRRIEEQSIPAEAFFLTEEAAAAARVPLPDAPARRRGLKREVYGGDTLLSSQSDQQIDEWYGYDLPNAEVSVRWVGEIQPPEPGRYELETVSDDGVRVWIDDELVIDDWLTHTPRRTTATVELDEEHAIRVDYFNLARTSSICTLRWKRPGGEEFEVVPASAFWP